ERIIGGQEVLPYSVKYQASLLNNHYKHYCGGALIHPQWVVSAAHCWNTYMKVRLGEHNLIGEEGFEQTFSVSEIIQHHFNPRNYDNDIMLIKLNRTAQLNANIQPVEVATTHSKSLFTDKCTVSGWGVTSISSDKISLVLHAVDVHIFPYCSYYYYWMKMSPNVLCAGSHWGGKDSCQGDSGGPLVCHNRLEGIVSWGIGCASQYFPGVYTKVRNYEKWIKDIIDKHS
ncbi:hypothetical protein LDENG_00281470, partial [Lucifuga dentata]